MRFSVVTLVANNVQRPAFTTTTSSSSLSSTTSNLVPLVSNFLGGLQTDSTIDMARVNMRLESFNSYAIITALLLNATLRLYCMTPKIIDNDGKSSRKDNIALILFVLFAGTSLLCNAYSSLAFSLLSLYSKTALGMGRDRSFLEFFDATTIVRKRAFHSFLVALLSFKLCFATSLYINYDGNIRWWLIGISTGVGILSWFHWQTIIATAGNLLFRR